MLATIEYIETGYLCSKVINIHTTAIPTHAHIRQLVVLIHVGCISICSFAQKHTIKNVVCSVHSYNVQDAAMDFGYCIRNLKIMPSLLAGSVESFCTMLHP